MRLIGPNPGVAIALAVFWAAAACAQTPATAPAEAPAASAAPPSSSTPVILDRVAAVINDAVILESDVQEEMRFADLQGALESGESARQGALDRLIDRYLILQQIKATQARTIEPTPDEVKQQVDNLRRQIPQCAEEHCETDAGWHAFLTARGLTEQEVNDHWRERILILAFIQSRFGTGIRISQTEVEDYYQQNLAPEFARRKLQPPPLAKVSSRIEEILLQQRVNTFLQEWLQSLKQQGNVSILNDDSDNDSSAPGRLTAPANERSGGHP
jgi:peptidyl-prolyl cis-trans isomerase SurA